MTRLWATGLAVVLAGCASASSSDEAQRRPPATASPGSTAAPALVVTPAPTPSRRVPAPKLPRNSVVPVAGEPLVDGEYFGFLKAVDIDRDKLRVDFAQWLSGKTASRIAYADGYVDSPDDAVPNDYYIHNASRDVWTVPLASRVLVTVWECPRTCGQYKGTIEGLATSMAVRPRQGRAYGVYEGRLGKYWLKFRLGQVVRIDEIFTP